MRGIGGVRRIDEPAGWDDANDEDEDEEDEEDEEEEEHLAPADSTTIIPVDEPVFPPEGTEPRLLTLFPPPSTTTTYHNLYFIPPPIDHRDDIPKSEQPPRKRLYLSTLGSRYEIRESSTARPTRGRGIDYGFVSMVDAEERRQGIRDVGYGIRDTWVDLAEAVPEIAPMTMGETQHQVHETRFQMQQAELAALRETDRRRQDQMVETLRVIRDMRREMSDMQAELLALREQQRRARQPGPEARIPDHQDASGDADSHI
ncbi:hypothetical protein Tco_0394520 [Tanacetum coccineum]